MKEYATPTYNSILDDVSKWCRRLLFVADGVSGIDFRNMFNFLLYLSKCRALLATSDSNLRRFGGSLLNSLQPCPKIVPCLIFFTQAGA